MKHSFYDVKIKKKVSAEVTQKVTYGPKGNERYAFKAKTADGRNLTVFVAKAAWLAAKIKIKVTSLPKIKVMPAMPKKQAGAMIDVKPITAKAVSVKLTKVPVPIKKVFHSAFDQETPLDFPNGYPHQSSPHSYLYEVWYGTNRAPVTNEKGKITSYSNDRSKGSVYYGKCKVIIPQSHQFGSTGSSWWRRWLRMTDDRLKLEGLSSLTEADFWAELKHYLSTLDLNERFSVVFLHGYNISFLDAAIRSAQIGFDLKIPGAMAFFSWPSKADPAAYLADEESIQASEDEISVFLSNFARQTGSEKVHIIAHSMGNRGLLRAIQRITHDAEKRSGIKFGQVILAAPDVDVDLFKDLARLYPSVSERTTLYVSAKDRAVALSQIVHDYDRVGFIPPVTVVPGIDTVEVTNIDLSLLGHGYIATAEAVLYDMYELIFHNTAPNARTRLSPKRTITAAEPYWIINA